MHNFKFKQLGTIKLSYMSKLTTDALISLVNCGFLNSIPIYALGDRLLIRRLAVLNIQTRLSYSRNQTLHLYVKKYKMSFYVAI